MSATPRRWALGTLGGLLLLAACGGPESSDGRSLVGTWRTESYMSQLGPTTMSCTFGADGRYAMEVTLAALPKSPMTAAGTWRLEGSRLRLEGKKAQTWSMGWDGEVLVLTEKNGDSYRLSRVEGP